MSDRHRTIMRLIDRLVGVLLRRAWRRSLVVTIATGLLVAHWLGLSLSLQDGLLVGVGLIAIDVIVLLVVMTLGARLLGDERREVVLDMLIHPVARRAIGGELRLLAVYPRALWRRLRPVAALQFSYHRGSSSLGMKDRPARPGRLWRDRARRARDQRARSPARGDRRIARAAFRDAVPRVDPAAVHRIGEAPPGAVGRHRGSPLTATAPDWQAAAPISS